MNMVLVVMPTLLMVLTTSAGIHLANYWRHAAHSEDCSDANNTAVIRAARQAAKPCLLASFTTAIGLLSLCSSTLIPVRDFGIFSALGCGISLLAVLYVLPSLMMYWRSKRPSEQELRKENWNLLGRFVFQYRTPIIAACALLACFSIYGLNWFDTETKVIRYFPEESRIIKDYRFIEQNLCGIVPVDTVIRFDHEAQEELDMFQRMEVVRKIEAKMKQHPDISGVVSLATFNPSRVKPQKGMKRLVYNRRFTSSKSS